MKKLIRIMSLILTVTLLSGAFSMTPTVRAADKPTVSSSKAAMLYCMESDTVLFEKSAAERFAPGVLTKLMVAVIVAEEALNRGMNYDTEVTASRNAVNSTRGKHISMQVGEVFRIRCGQVWSALS